ncbi:hypothetical protein GDO86_000332 [Hymenochirus boettgeri]|uniref:OCIA domain-containing protein 1 n=1 Tax=Hymenochirus boettgeri TaxID=247094 RepID=A0A8T2K816_9PIPI|nr:hypothetical protein GDO86_000332 [Hymenochirus boettgeri]
MAPSTADYSGGQHPPSHGVVQPPGVGYIPTEDERRVFKECNEESFWYRSLPISAVSMVVTQGLISKVAGFCGYLAGKLSYMKTCQEKFKRLENSPLGEAIRQGSRYIPERHPTKESEFADGKLYSSATAETFTSAAAEPPSSVYSSQYESREDTVPFSATLSESSPTGITDTRVQEPEPLLEESPKRKAMTYDELRSRNRETYEMAVTQRPDAPVRSSQDRAPRKEGKTNKYGDVWEE